MSTQCAQSRIVVATRNARKIDEIREILGDVPWDLLPVTKIIPDFFVVEDGQTYIENAIKKAVAAAHATKTIAIADDSGLEIDALDGAPGLYSARFGGEHLPQSQKNTLILRQMCNVQERSARFRCIIAVATPNGVIRTAEGVCAGMIGTEPRGRFGFGYDPLFFLPEYGKTMAELEPAIKNTVSHRARALAHLHEILPEFLF